MYCMWYITNTLVSDGPSIKNLYTKFSLLCATNPSFRFCCTDSLLHRHFGLSNGNFWALSEQNCLWAELMPFSIQHTQPLATNHWGVRDVITLSPYPTYLTSIMLWLRRHCRQVLSARSSGP